jgi:hypothetical protein
MSEGDTKSKYSWRVAVTVFALVLLACASAAYWFADSSSGSTCGFCQRPLSPNLFAVAEIDGKKFKVCCVSCALTEANQRRRPVRLLEVHDYPTGKSIDPAKAFYVSDSRATACMHDAAPMDQSKHSEHLEFDRCSPGTFTFGDKNDAEAFVRANGGVLLSYAQVMAKMRYQ